MGEVDGDIVGRDAPLSAQLRPDRGRVTSDTLEDIRHLQMRYVRNGYNKDSYSATI